MADQPVAAAHGGPPQRRAPLPSLTGLRFLAAMLVFLAHSSMLASPLVPTAPLNFFGDPDVAKGVADFFDPAGNIGVSFFFVLSGFVLTWSWTPGEPVTSFWRRRVLKLYPNHVVVWVVAMWLFASSGPVRSWLPNLFLVHAFSNDVQVVRSVNHPSWSLCSELLFYALFPLFIILVWKIAERRLWLWAGLLVAGVGSVTLVTKLVPGGPRVPGLDLPLNQQWFSYAFPPPRLFEFVLGMVLARIVIAGLWPRIGLLPSAGLFAVGYWAAVAVPDPYGFSLTTVVPVSMIICAAATTDLRGEGGWLRSRTMVWLGNVSFGFYIVQGVLIFYGRPEVLGDRTYDTLPAIGMLITLFAANLLAAWLLFSLVEQPVMRRWSRSRKQRPPQAAAPQDSAPLPAGAAVSDGPAQEPAPRPAI